MNETDIINSGLHEDTVNLIREAIECGTNSLTFYNMLLNQVRDAEDTYIITEIMDEETRHTQILKDIFFGITNSHIEDVRSIYVENRSIIDDYTENLKNALFDEMNSIKKYRKILDNMQDSRSYNMMMEIITDKLCHANMYNYLINKNIT